MTNAEKIRAMSDKKLAKWVKVCISECHRCPAYKFCGDLTTFSEMSSCADILMLWLEQEAKDD